MKLVSKVESRKSKNRTKRQAEWQFCKFQNHWRSFAAAKKLSSPRRSRPETNWEFSFFAAATIKVFSFVNAQFRVCVFLTGFLGLGIKEKHELFRRDLSLAVRLAVFYNFREKNLYFSDCEGDIQIATETICLLGDFYSFIPVSLCLVCLLLIPVFILLS